ncbi:SANT/Myb_domain [Hexamita inflata]|uniref:SANT/Myb domain n=1 Tax=Hexamita inflata TaxID=28002 RepID=A0AA86TKS6_9EUKA|nr:SANT/Myb domain [Hexamita inflata]
MNYESNQQQTQQPRTNNRWSADEQKLFQHLYQMYKKQFNRYVPHFVNRTETQIKSFYFNILHKNREIASKEKEKLNKKEESSQITLIVFDNFVQ